MSEWAVIACGALSADISEISQRRNWPLKIYPLPPLLHNHPKKIAGAVRELLPEVIASHKRVVIAYADCGTYGALDEVVLEFGIDRLAGSHCYDVFATKERIGELMAEEPGTYYLTDYLVRSFHRSVIVELGLDRYPELRPDYFANYQRVLRLAQQPTPELTAMAEAAAAAIELPLSIEVTGTIGLERQLETLLVPR
jgi:hypothetical protein